MSELANALIVVDLQNDFADPSGSLPVEGGDAVAEKIRHYIEEHVDDYVLVVATKDWHPSPDEDPDFDHFSDDPDYVDTWPVHCVHDTHGAEFHANLQVGPETFDKVFYKGQMSAAYSGFEGASIQGGYAVLGGWSLDAYLKDHRIGHVDICGLATDYCVGSTAMDAQTLGYDVTVLTDLCAGVSPDSTEATLHSLDAIGVHLS